MREQLADLCHKQGSGGMEYLFSKCFAEVGQFDKDTGNLVIPEQAVKRGRQQMNTSYNELSEKEKESDRKEADRFLKYFFIDAEYQPEYGQLDYRGDGCQFCGYMKSECQCALCNSGNSLNSSKEN